MLDKLIAFSIKNKLIIGVFVFVLIGWGTFSLKQIPLDAIPDITNNQVIVITQAPSLATQEVEQLITSPIEISFSNLPDVVEIRSISRFGISVITVVFEEDVDSYLARQQISEQLKLVENDIPKHFGTPELAPLTTGLGEVFQYILHTTPEYDTVYSAMDLRSMNDWIVKRQLSGTKGVIEVNGWGGFLKQYEVAVTPEKLNSFNLSIKDVFDALANNNENTGGSYIEKKYSTYFIRANGVVKTLKDIESIVVSSKNGVPVLIKDIGSVKFGSAPRYGAISWNGKGEVVSGQALMLKGENSYAVVNAIKAKLASIQSSLPEGVILEPFMDRSGLIERSIATVTKNLVEGGLIVIFILVLLLGNFRGGLIVASVIPLALLFALGMMNVFGVSANLMSLGAIDFGLIVDGAVIIVESIIHRLNKRKNSSKLTQEEMDEEVRGSSVKIRSSAAFGEIIILIVYIPILALVGIEGKTFGPMAQTVSFAILGALILSVTYVPMMCALFLKKKIKEEETFSDKIMHFFQRIYTPVLKLALKFKLVIVLATVALFLASIFTFNHLGGEFIPTLEEGDFALHQILPPGSSLKQSVLVSTKIQKQLMSDFPEIEHIVTKIGSAEVPTDPMPMEVGDIMVKMKPKSEWQYQTKEGMFEAMRQSLSIIPGVQYEFTQPIQMRFNELISGSRKDIAVKIYGEDLEELSTKGKKAEDLIKQVSGASDIKLDQVTGLPQLVIDYNRQKIAQYGTSISRINSIVETAFAGGVAGVVFEGERRFDLVVRLAEKSRQDIKDVKDLLIPISQTVQIPLKELAEVKFEKVPMQISRENSKRRITVGVNTKGLDVETLVANIKLKLNQELDLKPGYYIEYGGQFENLKKASERLQVAVPIALILILILLYFTFGSIKQSLLIFTAIPLSAIGGVYALYIREMPFSISAGVGFIALFGVAVLNGIVLIGYFNQLKKEGMESVNERIIEGTKVRLRPVLITALVAALGFLPMAISNSAGGEVQKPLATVVIGGLISATLLTLFVLPILYSWIERIKFKKTDNKIVIGLLIISSSFYSQLTFAQAEPLSIENAVELAKINHPSMRVANLEVSKQNELKNVNYGFDKTNLNYSRGQINSIEQDYQFSIAQSFKFPSYYSKTKALNAEELLKKELEKSITEQSIEYQVREIYIELYSIKDQIINAKELTRFLDEYHKIAQKKQKAGELTLIEAQVLGVKKFKAQSALKSLEDQYELMINQLALLIGEENKISIEHTSFYQLPFSLSDSIYSNAPLLLLSKQEININKQNLQLKKAEALPDWSIGYFNQQLDGVQGFQGINLGLKVPLLFLSEKGKIKAAKIDQEIAIASMDRNKLELQKYVSKELNTIEKLKRSISYIESEGIPLVKQLLKTNQTLLKEGEVGYLRYLEALKDYNSINLEYINSLKDYNQTVLRTKALLGAF